MDGPAVAELMAHVAAAVSRRAAAVSEDVYEVILREIPELRDDKSVLTLLASSVHSNVGTCLQVMQHQIDLSAVQAPAAALEYARRRAQRGTPLTALLRPWVLSTLAGLADDDEHHVRLRETLLVFLQSGGSYKTTAEQLMLHKNTVQYRIRKAKESLGRPVGENRHDVELALRASHWLGSSVLRSGLGGNAIQFAKRLVIEGYAFGGQVLPQVGHGAGPGDQQHVGGQLQQPLQCDLGRGDSETGGGSDDDRAGEHGVVPAARPAERAERHERDAAAEALRQNRGPAAVGEVEQVLHADDVSPGRGVP